MITLKKHIVPGIISDIRLVDYIPAIFPEFTSRSGIKKAIKRGEVLVNGKSADQGIWMKQGNKIELVDKEQKPPKVFELNLDVIHEDNYLAVINKPAGIVVSGNKYRTVFNALSYNLQDSKAADALKWPQPVHRLDYSTSGLLIIAKTKLARITLGDHLEKRMIKKTYRAIVSGTIPEHGTIEYLLDGQEAITHYQICETAPSIKTKTISLVELNPVTGRTHQLRRHMAEIGHPIVGDGKYGTNFPILKGKGLFLSATGVDFLHPVTMERLFFEIAEPRKFKSLLKREKRRWEKYNS